MLIANSIGDLDRYFQLFVLFHLNIKVLWAKYKIAMLLSKTLSIKTANHTKCALALNTWSEKAQLTEKVPPPLSFPALTSLKVFGMSSHSISSVQHLLRAALLLSFRRLPSDIVTFTYSTWQGKTSTLIELWFPRLLSMIWNLRVADKDW